MPKLPVLKARELIRMIQQLGFFEIRQRGSHKQFKHPDGRFTTIPVHAGRDISPALLRKVLEDVRVSPEEFLRLPR